MILDIFYYLKMNSIVRESNLKTKTMDLTKKETKSRPQQDIANDIKEAVKKLNAFIVEASNANIKVETSQKFHPMMNSIGAPLNPTVNVTISETTSY